jgi:signal transduction histidine kinase
VFALVILILLVDHKGKMMRWLRYMIILLCTTELEAVEILEADPDLSGRLMGPGSVDAAFGSDSWAAEFRLNDYLVGSIHTIAKVEVAVLFAFRINQRFLDELNHEGSAQFMFTVPSLHEGDAGRVLPVEVLLLERNARSAIGAAESRPARSLGRISKGELEVGRLYQFALEDLGGLQVGDTIWIGLNGCNPLDGKNHNFLVGGDMISLPGSVPPMLVAGREEALSETVMGMSSLTLLHRRLNAPKHPGVERETPSVTSRWVNPFTSQEQIGKLDAIHRVLRRELEKLPTARRLFRAQSLGFHSSVKPLDEGWTLRLPVNGVATAICLVPALTAEGDRIEPFAFPKRFSIIAYLPNGAGKLIVADWTHEDFPLHNSTPVVFSFPWQDYESIEFTIIGGKASGSGHFFALEELFLYRPVNEKQLPTVVEIAKADSIVDEPYWSPDYLNDGHTSLGPTFMEKESEGSESIISFPGSPPATTEINLALPKMQLMWSIDLYPINDPENPGLPSASFPKKMVIEFANDPEFSEIVQSIDATPSLRPVPPAGNPVNIRFEPLTAGFIRLRFEELPVSDGVAQLGLAEIRANDAHSLADAEIALHGFPAAIDPKSFIDNYANGHRLGDPLPWIIRLIRRDVVTTELAEVVAGMETLQVARQRTLRLLFISLGGAVVLLFIGVLVWQKRKSAAENLRVRRRIQQDLHDEIGSNLGTVSLVTSHLLSADLPPEYLEELSDVNRSAREATSSLREVIWLTDKSILTLDKAFIYMQMRAEQMVRDCKLVVDAPKNVPSHSISSVFKRNLFLLFTEAIHNCVKHAEATKVMVTFAVSGSDLAIRVADNGRGFDPETVRQGIGLQSMRDRAAQMGGQIQITSNSSVGTTIELTTKLASAR